MKKLIRISLAVITVILMSVMSGHARGGHVHGSVWIGPSWGPAWSVGWWGVPYMYPYFVPPSVTIQPYPVIIQQPAPEVYVQPAPQPDEQNYWYYCQNPKGYYPYVKQCPNGWMKVVPSSPVQQGKE